MNASAAPARTESLRIAGEKVACARSFEVPPLDEPAAETDPAHGTDPADAPGSEQ